MDNKRVRDLVGGKGTDLLLVGRIVGPFLGGLDGSLALFDGTGQLAIEMRSVAKLVISCPFLGCGRASVRGEVRRLRRKRNEYGWRRGEVYGYLPCPGLGSGDMCTRLGPEQAR
jgi:hypothetical protein